VFLLHIGTDPTTWWVSRQEAIEAVAQELQQATTATVELPVEFPLVGTLVVSPRCAGAVWVGPPPPTGSHPTGAKLPSPAIRVPSAVAATPEAPGTYPLPASPDLASLQQIIEAAMLDGMLLTVKTSSVPSADLVLSGTSLAYVVLCPQS
jgi:hypothetical protein